MLEHASLFADWLNDHGGREMAIVVGTTWPYRFAVAVDAQLATASTVDTRGSALVNLLAEIFERQQGRLRGTDYSTAYEPWEPFEVWHSPNIAALRFDPRAIEPGQIERDAPSILHALKRELERALEVRA